MRCVSVYICQVQVKICIPKSQMISILDRIINTLKLRTEQLRMDVFFVLYWSEFRILLSRHRIKDPTLTLLSACLVSLFSSLSPDRGTSQARHQAPPARERKGWYSENLNFCFLTESLSGNMHPAAASPHFKYRVMLCTASSQSLYCGLKTLGREKNVECCSKS